MDSTGKTTAGLLGLATFNITSESIMIDEITLIVVCLSWMGLFIPALLNREASNIGDQNEYR